MPVIINDFEIIPTHEDQAPAQPGSQAPAQEPALKPIDIERIVRRFEERRERLRAD
jgi:hypothetical protein